jgi:TRAP-type C4-dicarboxylate transport system substrate-binding protein
LAVNHAVPKIVRAHFQAEVTRRVAEAGAGEIVWDEMHAGTLTRMGGVLEALEDDLALIGIVSVNHEARRLPLQNLTFQMPFTTESCTIVAAAYKTVHSNLAGMTDAMSAARQTYLSSIASDGYNLISEQPIHNAAEVRGLKVGVIGRLEDWIGGVLDIPQRLPDDTMGARMEAGVLGAAVLPTSEIGQLGLKRYADHYTRTGFGSQVQRWAAANNAAGRPGREAVAMFIDELRTAGVTLTRDWSRAAPSSTLGPSITAAKKLSLAPAK